MPENVEQILDSLIDGCVALAWKLAGALLVFLIGNLLIRFIIKRLKTGKLAAKLDPMVRSFLTSVAKIGLYVILMVIIVSILGIETASIIAVIASVGAAIALGLQGSLSHLAGGVMLLIFRPFKIGNFVEVCGYSGTVTEVGIFYTEITTTDNRICVIPNGTLISSSIVNYSVKDTRRVDMVFDVAYGTNVELAKQIILDEVAKVSAVLDTPAPFIRMTEMAGSSLKITLRVWCNNADYWGVKFDLNEAINAAFVAKDIEIPYQQIDVHVKDR
jgi:small conductance mechanosensitive channel